MTGGFGMATFFHGPYAMTSSRLYRKVMALEAAILDMQFDRTFGLSFIAQAKSGELDEWLITRNSPNVCHAVESEGRRRCHRNRIRSNRRIWALRGYDNPGIRRTIDRHRWAFARFCCNHTSGKPA
jgi:hypothetical protein